MSTHSRHPTRLLIADRRPMNAHGLAATLRQAHDFQVQGQCHDPNELRASLHAPGADVVILDPDLYGDDPVRAIEQVRAIDSLVAVLLLMTRVDDTLLHALAYEQVSCVSAYGDATTVVSALRSLLAGQPNLPPEVQSALTARLRLPPSAPVQLLTPREEQVFALAATGLTVAETACRLHISHSTAKTHLHHVYEKLDAPNRYAAVATAIARGLLDLDGAAA